MSLQKLLLRAVVFRTHNHHRSERVNQRLAVRVQYQAIGHRTSEADDGLERERRRHAKQHLRICLKEGPRRRPSRCSERSGQREKRSLSSVRRRPERPREVQYSKGRSSGQQAQTSEGKGTMQWCCQPVHNTLTLPASRYCTVLQSAKRPREGLWTATNWCSLPW